jgi:hypothetical protein
LKAAHTQIIRMPVRGPSDNPSDPGWGNEPEFKQAAQYVKQLGMAPLVILRAKPATAQTLDVDLEVVEYMTDLFDGQTVYYEFGNEPDLNNNGFIPAAEYVAKWNTTVPELEDAAGPDARFIGPVSYQYDEPYLETCGGRPRCRDHCRRDLSYRVGPGAARSRRAGSIKPASAAGTPTQSANTVRCAPPAPIWPDRRPTRRPHRTVGTRASHRPEFTTHR